MSDPRNYQIVFDIATLGEFAGRVVGSFCDHRDIEAREDDDLVVAEAALEVLRLMFDRAEFARSVLEDVDSLDPLVNFEAAEGFPGEFVPE